MFLTKFTGLKNVFLPLVLNLSNNNTFSTGHNGGSFKILSDNGTEFKNKLMEEVSKELGVEYKIYSPPYRPQIMGE